MYHFREDDSLIEIRGHLRSDRSPKPSILGVAAVVCLILVAVLAVAQVTHVHAVASDADHCPLCIAMHSVVPFALMVASVLLVRIGVAAPTLLGIRTIIQSWNPTLFSRPPPASC